MDKKDYEEYLLCKFHAINSGLKKKHIYCWIPWAEARNGQEDAISIAQNFANSFIKDENPTGLLFVGGVGSGKTFIVAGIVNYIAIAKRLYEYDTDTLYDYEDSPFPSDFSWIRDNCGVCFIVLSELYEHLRHCYNRNYTWETENIIEHLKTVDLLVLDDLGAENTTDWTKEILFNIVDYRYNAELPLIITTNCVPEELKAKIGDRIFDRIREMCALVPVTAKSQRPTATI